MTHENALSLFKTADGRAVSWLTWLERKRCYSSVRNSVGGINVGSAIDSIDIPGDEKNAIFAAFSSPLKKDLRSSRGGREFLEAKLQRY